ncbi:MAG: hypothetical protein K2N21_07615 [Rikenellaceae bacterium]|nr:hypothetical protein [Rikenellaceae bacterium]
MKSKKIDGNNIIYHIIQKQIILAGDSENPSRETKFLIEQLLLWGGIWFTPEVYQTIPVLLPYVIRDASCRKIDPATGKDTRGIATEKGLLPDDNSSIKGIPRSLNIISHLSEMNGNRMGNGFVASHIWRKLEKHVSWASQYEATNSFVPNLVWLPSQLSKLTDRDGYAQHFLQYLSGRLYKNIALKNPSVQSIWNELKVPDITPVCDVDIKKLNYFDATADWIAKRRDTLNKELQSILYILNGQPPCLNKINVGNYVPTLQQVVLEMTAEDKDSFKQWITDNL